MSKPKVIRRRIGGTTIILRPKWFPERPGAYYWDDGIGSEPPIVVSVRKVNGQLLDESSCDPPRVVGGYWSRRLVPEPKTPRS